MEQTSQELKSASKRMPYSVPQGFFHEIEESVMGRVRKELQPQAQAVAKRKPFRSLFTAAMAVAAALALVIGLKIHFNSTAGDFSQVEQAFYALSDEDQDYLLELYQEDMFMDMDSDVEAS